MAVGLGECLPELRQGKVSRRLQWARGGTDRDARGRMMILPGGSVSGGRGSSPPVSGAPVHRLWAVPPRNDKAVPWVQSVCLFVLQHVRPKFACKACQAHVVIAQRLPEPIEKGLPGPGLLAHVAVSKYADHCVQGKAVQKMRVGLSRSGCRTRPQTTGVLRRSRAVVVSDPGKGATRSRQVRTGKTSESEPSMTCRKRMLGSKPGSGGCPGISTGGACRRTVRPPAQRRRESGSGFCTEPWNLSPRCQGRRPNGGPIRA
jgi:hypothetical protein